MSRQIQSRRGTAAEHENFIGAIGEITMDTTNKTLRVHDGTTPGGFALARADAVFEGATLPEGCDFVIETQFPSADNNYTWYRKYNSGWVEQGGYLAAPQATTINIVFPVKMFDAYYCVSTSFRGNSTTGGYSAGHRDTTQTGMLLIFPYSASSGNTGTWQVSGLASTE